MKQTSRTRMMLAATFSALFATLVLAEPCRADSFTDALDASGLVWTNLGAWTTGGASISHDGVDGAEDNLMLGSNGSISSSLKTTVMGPSLVSFWWKMTSSSSGFYSSASLALSVDGQSAVSSYCANCGWSQQTVVLSSGSHNLQWSHTLMIQGTGFILGSAYLDQVVVTQVVCPIITSQPQSQTVSGGTNVIFTVQAIGADPLIYQWQLNSTNLPDATNVSLTITNVQLQNGGTYSIVVSNSCGIATSSNVVLIVQMPPVITQQPYAQTVNAGNPATFNVSAGGANPLWYQWRLNGSPVGIASTNNSYTITIAQTNDAGLYSVVVSNAYGIAVSSNALLTVRAIPVITSQPSGQSVLEAYFATFTVNADGPAPLKYQWQFNGTNIGGATNRSLTLVAVRTNQTGYYSVVVSNSYSAVASSNALFTVTPWAPTPSLGEAVNAPALVWRTSGKILWQAQTNVTHDGLNAAGIVSNFPDNQSGMMWTTVVGPGTISFYWFAVSTYTAPPNPLPGNGAVGFVLDGTYMFSQSSSSWDLEQIAYGPGEHTLCWSFGCQYYDMYGITPAAIVDQVVNNGATPTTTSDSASINVNGRFGFNVACSASLTLVIEGSTNLLDWTPLQTNVLGSLLWTFSDPDWTNYPARFYRVRSP